MTWMVADLSPASSPAVSSMTLDLEAVLLGPARVHAQQHVGPVLALGAARAGVDLEIAVVAVRLAGEQRLELAARDLGLERAQRLLGVGDDAWSPSASPSSIMPTLIVEIALDAGDRGELVLERGALLHHALRALRIVPEIGVFGERVQLGKPPAALSTSKMPPQQPDRLLDLFDHGLISARMAFSVDRGRNLAHDPEKWHPVFGKRSCGLQIWRSRATTRR